MHFFRLPLLAVACCSVSLAHPPNAVAQTAIVTHHNDASRSGWNATETVLTPANVGTPGPQGTFGRIAAVALDGEVDAQPLVVPGVVIAGDPHAGQHDVVYVATQANTIYAIDPTAGTVLLSRSLGTATGRATGCNHADIGVGITGTPVIDVARKALYVVAYTNDPGPGGTTKQVYRLHKLNLATLADMLPPVVVAGTGILTDGSTVAFNAGYQRQQPALLEFGNVVYTVFGSFCDNPRSRGWVFGWNANTLAPANPDTAGAPIGALTNRQTTEPTNPISFLTGVWMSGAGPAADGTGIYYVTANGDPSGTRYDPVNNTEQSVVRLGRTTVAVKDLFTPSNFATLDKRDGDFGAGGVILLPSPGPGHPPMAAAAGKFGILYLLNRDNLGGLTPGGPDKVLAQISIGSCRCAPAYFDDGVPTLVTSGGSEIGLWEVKSTPKIALVKRAATLINTGADPGFFTSVSSDGTSNTIIWAVSRPLSADKPRVFLYAYGVPAPGQGKTLTKLFVSGAGLWETNDHNASIVPVVANGRVYVASKGSLSIFGLLSPAASAAAEVEDR